MSGFPPFALSTALDAAAHTQAATGTITSIARIAVVATNGRLTKTAVTRVAQMADAGLPRAIVPVHTIADGDTVFALATGTWRGSANLTTIGAAAADQIAGAIVRAVRQATTAGRVLAARDLPQ